MVVGSGAALASGASQPPSTAAALSVLVVDDEATVVRTLARVLGARGLHVRACSTAAEALRPGVVDAYDVVLLDVHLPGESGIEAARQFRADGFEGGIIMLSGLRSAEVKSEALLAGADDYVTKPFGALELWARIQAVVRRCSRAEAPLLEVRGRAVHVRGVPVRLTRTERRILLDIHGAAETGLRREELVRQLSASDPDHALDVHVSRIRKKLGRAGRCLELTDGRYWLDVARSSTV